LPKAKIYPQPSICVLHRFEQTLSFQSLIAIMFKSLFEPALSSDLDLHSFTDIAKRFRVHAAVKIILLGQKF